MLYFLGSAVLYFHCAINKLAYEVLDFRWVLFYPSVYTFSMWQVCNRAKNINSMVKGKGVFIPDKTTYHNGLFIGMAIGLVLGLQWCFLAAPLFGAISASPWINNKPAKDNEL